jgi:hypothetical protein
MMVGIETGGLGNLPETAMKFFFIDRKIDISCYSTGWNEQFS